MISDESAESDVNEIEGDYQLVMEVWVEPQLGTMEVSSTPLSYLHGLEYFEIPEKVFYQNMHYAIICFWNWVRYILPKKRLYWIGNPLMANAPSQRNLIDLSLYNESINFDDPGNIFLFKFKKRNTRKRCEVCSMLTMKT